MNALIDWNRKEFYLKYWIIIFLMLILIVSCLCYYLDDKNIYDFDNINDLLINKFLINREGILISVAAIFIGIYFSIFTVLLTIKSSSKIVNMGIKTYKELIEFLRNAFIGSFIYVIYAIVFPIMSFGNEIGIIKFSRELILGIFMIYMLLSALRVGIAFIYIFKNDLNNFYENIEKESLEIEEQNEIIHKLRRFLEEYELKEGEKKAEVVNSTIRFTNPKPNK